jgi:hypothetical protein
MAESANELSKNADRLKEIIDFFNVKKIVQKKSLKKETPANIQKSNSTGDKLVSKPIQPILKKTEGNIKQTNLKQSGVLQNAKQQSPVKLEKVQPSQTSKNNDLIIKKQQIPIKKTQQGAYINMGSSKSSATDEEYERF